MQFAGSLLTKRSFQFPTSKNEIPISEVLLLTSDGFPAQSHLSEAHDAKELFFVNSYCPTTSLCLKISLLHNLKSQEGCLEFSLPT